MKLALGTVQFGLSYGVANQTGQVTRPAAVEMLSLATTHGIDTLDTAVAYGESEACLGEAGVYGFKVVTKLPALPEQCEDVNQWVREQVDASLARLGVTTLYGLLLHRSENLCGINGKRLYNALQDQKDGGRVHKVGISIYSPNELEPIVQQYQLDLVQAPFNLVDRRLLATRWLHRLKDLGVEVHTRSAFLQGLLLLPKAAMPLKFAPWHELWARWHYWLAVNKTSAVAACVAFPLAVPEIDRVVVGADSAEQLAQIIGEAHGSLTSALPDLQCDDENLVNPSCWNNL